VDDLMSKFAECCAGLTVDEIEQAILTSAHAASIPDSRTLALYLASRATA
jgi:hypothetical protein